MSDYVLGTDEAEAARLALQHDVWRPCVLDLWRRAGLTSGSRVADVGAGPGAATLDLADLVGDRGRVVAIERSARFVEVLRRRAPSNVDVVQADLMTHPVGVAGHAGAADRRAAAAGRRLHLARVRRLRVVASAAGPSGARRVRRPSDGEL